MNTKNKAWVGVKGRADGWVQSPVDGRQGAGELHVVGQLAQLGNVKGEERLDDLLALVAGYKAGFHLHLRPQAAGPQPHISQIEPSGHRVFQGLLDVAVPQAFAFTWHPTAVTVLPGLPVGEDDLLSTQTQALILQRVLA